MNLVVRDPFWKEFNTLSSRFNRLFDLPREENNDFLGAWSPAVDIYDKGVEVVIHAEVPGMKKEDIDVRVENNVLTIRGKKEPQGRGQGRRLLPDRAVLRNVQPFLQPAKHGQRFQDPGGVQGRRSHAGPSQGGRGEAAAD